jgi:NADH-quinone oxidoreductase subunit A
MWQTLGMLTLGAGLEQYGPLVVLLLIAIVFAVGGTVASLLLGPSRTGPVKEGTYESGMNPVHSARRRFNIRFYLLAMTFLVFDVEIVFLYPWATVFPNLAEGHYLNHQFLYRMLFFIGTSIVAYIYAWRKGVFKYD